MNVKEFVKTRETDEFDRRYLENMIDDEKRRKRDRDIRRRLYRKFKKNSKN